MDRVLHVVPIVALGACSATSRTANRTAAADSVVLERSPCFGSCPVYRLRIARDGAVDYQARMRGDSTHATDSGNPGTLAALVSRAREIGFYELPEDIAADKELCEFKQPILDRDGHTLRGTRRRGCVHYHGCRLAADHPKAPLLRSLTAFEVAIDSAAGSARWVRPAPFR